MIYWILITLVTALVSGQELCDPNLPTLSVGKENLIETIGQWNVFIQVNPFFLLGMGDSGCAPECCETEPILDGLSKHFAGKSSLSYPTKSGGREEIKIARMDLANEELFVGMGTHPSVFADRALIFIVKEGKMQKYQGFLDVPAELFHHMQRYVDPLVRFETTEQIEKFMDTKAGLWKGDNTGSLLEEGGSMD